MKLVLAFFLDLVAGDPENWLHPVRAIGWLIEKGEAILRRLFPGHLRLAGILLTFFICAISYLITLVIIKIAALIHPFIGFLTEVFFIYTALSIKSLKDAALDVKRLLESGNLAGARSAAGKMVGRDTENLSEGETARAAVESVAENTVDGIISPLFFAALGGAPLAMLFKAASTLDSMVGYRNERYEEFGWASARLDDALNFIPARVSYLLIPAAAWLVGMNARKSLEVSLRDGLKHPSPNSGIAEAAFAGALEVRLGGTNFRQGVPKPYPILGGEEARALEIQDIERAVQLSKASAVLWLFVVANPLPYLNFL